MPAAMSMRNLRLISNEKVEPSTTASGANTDSDIQASFDAERGNVPRTFAAGVNGKNAADTAPSNVSIRSSEPKSQEKFSASEGGQHPQGVCRIRSAPSSLTAARSRPPLHRGVLEMRGDDKPLDIGSASNFIRQIFNGHKSASSKEPKHKPAKRLCFGKDEQRNGRDLPLAAGRGI